MNDSCTDTCCVAWETRVAMLAAAPRGKRSDKLPVFVPLPLKEVSDIAFSRNVGDRSLLLHALSAVLGVIAVIAGSMMVSFDGLLNCSASTILSALTTGAPFSSIDASETKTLQSAQRPHSIQRTRRGMDMTLVATDYYRIGGSRHRLTIFSPTMTFSRSRPSSSYL